MEYFSIYISRRIPKAYPLEEIEKFLTYSSSRRLFVVNSIYMAMQLLTVDSTFISILRYASKNLNYFIYEIKYTTFIMPISIKFYPAGCGDAIRIKFWEEGQNPKNIFIDSGYMTTFLTYIKTDIYTNFSAEEKINLWVITHMDEDHINGMVSFLTMLMKNDKSEIIEELWFNCFEQLNLPDNSSNKSGIKNAIRVREYLTEEKFSAKVINQVISEITPVEIGNAVLTVLSPDANGYAALASYWAQLEEKYWAKKNITKAADENYFPADDAIKIEELASRDLIKEDENDVANRTSIAFLFEHPEISVLFLGDAHPSQVFSAIEQLNKSRGARLRVDYIKLSHHASRRNFHHSLLDVVECSRFVISSCGESCDGLPNKETLARILCRTDKEKKIYFYFNYDTIRFRKMFDVDREEVNMYNFECVFPEAEHTALFIERGTDG